MTGELLGLLAHELRSPVAALRAISETMRERRGELAPAEARRLLELALAAGRDVERLVVDATPGSVRARPLDVGRLVEDAVATARLGGRAIRYEAPADPPPVSADPVRIRQALANLIANADAHSPAGAEIVVAVETVPGGVAVSVADQGEGIAAADRERIFEPGVRLAARPGQGLGLAVARAVAEAHGGTLGVESAPGAGARFTLVLPAASATA
jgi:signal transduction histidine kinase